MPSDKAYKVYAVVLIAILDTMLVVLLVTAVVLNVKRKGVLKRIDLCRMVGTLQEQYQTNYWQKERLKEAVE